MCRMGCRSFWSWFDVNKKKYSRQKLSARVPWLHSHLSNSQVWSARFYFMLLGSLMVLSFLCLSFWSLSVISDHAMCRRQKWQVISWVVRCHGRRAITLTITAGENCRTQIRSIESRTSPGKFISLPGINNTSFQSSTYSTSEVSHFMRYINSQLFYLLTLM